MNKVRQFIDDFKKSIVYQNIIDDTNVEVIMIFLTGSTLLNIADNNSDYDLCVLVKEKPVEPSSKLFKIYNRPGAYFIYYKPQEKIAQWIYNDVNDIVNITSTPLDNIGWAQFKYITEDYILYKNQNYLDFISALLDKRNEISNYALYLFVKTALDFIDKNMISNNLLDLNRNLFKPMKLLAHICWAADILQDKEPDKDKINTIKRILLENLSKKHISYIDRSISFLKSYLQSIIIPQNKPLQE